MTFLRSPSLETSGKASPKGLGCRSREEQVQGHRCVANFCRVGECLLSVAQVPESYR